MDETRGSVDDLNMASTVRAVGWLTAKTLHQIQLLSCDRSELVAWESPDHCAPFWRLYWHDRRGAEINVGRQTIAIRPGHLVLIPPNTRFSSHLRNFVRQFFLHFLVEPRFRGSPDTVFQIPATKEQADLCRRIIAQLTTDALSIKASLLSQMLAASALLSLPTIHWEPRFSDPRITCAVNTISNAYPTKVDIRTLAREACLHPTAFIRLFRQSTGHTPLDYLMNLRLEEACTMLHYNDATLDEIAEKTGFGDRAYFSRVFSRSLNCSPARYRRMVNVSNRSRPGGGKE